MPTAERVRLAPTDTSPISAWVLADPPTTVHTTVIAVHDFTANGCWFGDVAADISETVRFVAPDLRGRASSSAAEPARSIDDHVSDLFDIGDRVDASTFTLIAHGTGGQFAMACAVAAPERVERLIIIDGPPLIRSDPATTWTEAARAIDPGITRLGRTYAHRDQIVAEQISSGRIPTQGLTRALRRAIDTEVVGSGFGWQPRLSSTAMERDWHLLSNWTLPAPIDVPTTVLRAVHGHCPGDPPIPMASLDVDATVVDTTHNGLLVDPSAVASIVAALES